MLCWRSVEASARNEAAQRSDRVSIFGCDRRGLRRVGEWRSGQQRSDRLSRRTSSSSWAAHRDRARCCGVAVVSGCNVVRRRNADSGGIAGQAELNGCARVVWLAFAGWLSVLLRGDDIRKTHRGGCVVVKSMQIMFLAMRWTFGVQADVWRVNGGCRDGGGLQYNRAADGGRARLFTLEKGLAGLRRNITLP